MMSSNKRSAPWGTMVALVVLIVMVIYQRLQPEEDNGAVEERARQVSVRPSSSTSLELRASPRKIEGYDVFENCTLLESRGNDGDSFHVSIPGRGDQEIRLYYVDTPESYRHQYNGERIGHQARYFDISDAASVELGMKAKMFVLHELNQQSFTVHTKWQEVFDSGRYYAFVKFKVDGEERWLHEVLVDRGLARIYTEGAITPDGDSVRNQKRKLQERENMARDAQKGGWAL